MLECANIPTQVNWTRLEIGGEIKKIKSAQKNVHRLRPLKNVQFCSRLRKTKILTTDIH
jgi:hypothetical protein